MAPFPRPSDAAPASGGGEGDSAPASGERPTRSGQARAYARLLAVAAVVVGLDQVTKQLALDRLQNRPFDLIDGVVTLRLAFNSGGAFGVLQGLPELFLVATLIVVAVILLWVRNIAEASWIVPLGMILGGGLGNLADRVFRDFEGRVVDFIDVHFWPVFNLADSSIVLGVGLILLLGARQGSEEQ